MADSDFTLSKFKKKFPIAIHEQPDLFAGVEPVIPSKKLISTLSETTNYQCSSSNYR